MSLGPQTQLMCMVVLHACDALLVVATSTRLHGRVELTLTLRHISKLNFFCGTLYEHYIEGYSRLFPNL